MTFFKLYASFIIIIVPLIVVSDICRNRYMQTCLNCIPSSVCTTISGSRLTSHGDECLYWCLIGKTSCKMATFENGNCMMYIQSHCDSVEEGTGRTVYRQTCTDDIRFHRSYTNVKTEYSYQTTKAILRMDEDGRDCLEYRLSSHTPERGTCNTITGSGATNQTELSCLSLCLDTAGCRGSTFWIQTGICDLHDCDSVISSDEAYFTGRTCLDKTSSTKQITPTLPLTTVPVSQELLNTTPYFELSGTTSSGISVLSLVSSDRRADIISNITAQSTSEDLLHSTPELTITTLSQLTTLSSRSKASKHASSLAFNLMSVQTTKSSLHNASRFFTQPSTIAILATVAGIAITAILTTVACCTIKEKSMIIQPIFCFKENRREV